MEAGCASLVWRGVRGSNSSCERRVENDFMCYAMWCVACAIHWRPVSCVGSGGFLPLGARRGWHGPLVCLKVRQSQEQTPLCSWGKPCVHQAQACPVPLGVGGSAGDWRAINISQVKLDCCVGREDPGKNDPGAWRGTPAAARGGVSEEGTGRGIPPACSGSCLRWADLPAGRSRRSHPDRGGVVSSLDTDESETLVSMV